ncbi:MAG TPA: indolepyruvate oxidoreductase [Deltaproteobacteria bacterium]|nr:indolepyruvate oxidoreductase [Deltaproteobacteria bacterium]
MTQQQIIISGVGGQGVLFVTRLLAEAAIQKGMPVVTSETHGMAQRGGTVISHLKVGDFSSVLIRPRHADGLLALKEENILQHGHYLKENGWSIVNCPDSKAMEIDKPVYGIDANRLAIENQARRSVNLILLGYALKFRGHLFCGFKDIKAVLSNRFSKREKLLNSAMKALNAGYHAA